MRYLKYLVVSLLLLLPINIMALSADVVLDCDKAMLSINEEVNCSINVNATNGGITEFSAITKVSSNLEISSITISSEWNNNSSGNNISVSSDTAKSGNVNVGSVKVKATSVVPETNESISLTNITLKDEEGMLVNKNDLSKNIRIPSNNASLTSLSTSVGTLSPIFSADNQEYYVDSVDSDSITITASGNANASIVGTGTKSLNYGTNTFEITVKAEAGNAKIYKLIVNRVDNRSSDSTLKSIKVNNSLISFDSNVFSYSVTLPSNEDTLNVVAEPSNSKATIKYSDNNRKMLPDELYTMYIYVTAENGSKKTYTVAVKRVDNRSSNNNLKSLVVNDKNITLNSNQSYTLTVDNKVTTADIKTTLEDTKAKVEISGNNNLKVGSNTFKIKVIAENEAIKTYTLTIIRKNADGDITNLSNNTNLKSLTITDYKIDFNKETLTYNIEVESNVKKLTLKYEVEDSKATVSVDGNKDFKEGLNTVKILVTAENGETATYTINVIQKSKNSEVENDKNKIINALKDKNKYEQVLVNANSSDNLVISNDIIKEIINSKKIITFAVKNDTLTKYSIILNGASFTEYTGNIDYKVTFDTDNSTLKELIGSNKNIILNFSHSGELPTGTVFNIYVGDTFANGSSLYLYYYNSSNELELNSKDLTVTEGYVNIPLDHCSTYVLLNTSLENKPDNQEPTTPDTPNTNKSNNNLILYVSIGGGVLLIILVVVIVITSKNKKKKDNKSEIKENLNNDFSNMTPIGEVGNRTLENTEIIDFGLDDFNKNDNSEYLFGISVMDIKDYIEKCPLSTIKKENVKDGVVIVSIEPNSPLGKVGIKQDAVLLELNGKKIIDKENFRNITRGVKHGDKYTIKYHQNGTTKKDKIII